MLVAIYFPNRLFHGGSAGYEIVQWASNTGVCVKPVTNEGGRGRLHLLQQRLHRKAVHSYVQQSQNRSRTTAAALQRTAAALHALQQSCTIPRQHCCSMAIGTLQQQQYSSSTGTDTLPFHVRDELRFVRGC